MIMFKHGGLLIIDQYCARYAAKITEGLYQRFIGMLGILAGGRPGMKTPRIAQGINRDIDLIARPGDNGFDFAGASLAKLLYHEKFLSASHGAISCGLVTNKERSCRSGGG